MTKIQWTYYLVHYILFLWLKHGKVQLSAPLTSQALLSLNISGYLHLAPNGVLAAENGTQEMSLGRIAADLMVYRRLALEQENGTIKKPIFKNQDFNGVGLSCQPVMVTKNKHGDALIFS